MIHERVNHGTWSHAGKQTKRCEACLAGIGTQEIDLKPMRRELTDKEVEVILIELYEDEEEMACL